MVKRKDRKSKATLKKQLSLGDFGPMPTESFKKRLRKAEKKMSNIDKALIKLERNPDSVRALTKAINVMVEGKLDNKTIQINLDEVTTGAPRTILKQVAVANAVPAKKISKITALFLALGVAIATSVSQTYISSIMVRIAYYLANLGAGWVANYLLSFITSTVAAIPGLVISNLYISALLIIPSVLLLLRNKIFIRSFASHSVQTASAATAKLSDEEQKKIGAEASSKLIHYLTNDVNMNKLIPFFTGLKDENTLTTIMTDLNSDPSNFLANLKNGVYHGPTYSRTFLNPDNRKMFMEFLFDIIRAIKYSYSGIKKVPTHVSMMIVKLKKSLNAVLKDGSQPSAASAPSMSDSSSSSSSISESSPSSSPSPSSGNPGGGSSKRRRTSRKQRKTIRKKVSKSMKRTFKKTRRQRR